MMCTRPQNTKEGMRVPCGRCIACRINRTQEWKLRILHEFARYNKGLFVTLTYNDENMPKNGGLVKSHLQGWIKVVRNDCVELKYYGVGEYGDMRKRPHYHLIVMGKSLEVVGKWKYGFEYFGSVTKDSINYVCGYIQKKLYGDVAKNEYGERLAPFAVMSKGMGLEWIEKNKDQLLVHLGVRLNGSTVRMPRYYRKKLIDEIPIDLLNERAMVQSVRRDDECLAYGISELERSERERVTRRQREIDLEWKKQNASKKDFGL